MPIETQEIEMLVSKYQQILETEKFRRNALEFAQESTKYQKVVVLTAAYEAGSIKGTNEKTREMSEYLILEKDPAYGFLLIFEQSCQRQLGDTIAQKQAHEARISLTKALLYSHSSLTF